MSNTRFGIIGVRQLTCGAGHVARAVELALHWPGPGSVVLNVGTGKNHSVMDMLEAATKAAAALHFQGSNFTNFTPRLEHQNAHPADVPETLAFLGELRIATAARLEKLLGFQQGIGVALKAAGVPRQVD